MTRITEAQNVLLRDAILAMKAVEKGQDGATETIRGIEKTVAALQLAVAAIDMLVRHAGEFQAADPARRRAHVPVPASTGRDSRVAEVQA